jgi:hypothetical protein
MAIFPVKFLLAGNLAEMGEISTASPTRDDSNSYIPTGIHCRLGLMMSALTDFNYKVISMT